MPTATSTDNSDRVALLHVNKCKGISIDSHRLCQTDSSGAAIEYTLSSPQDERGPDRRSEGSRYPRFLCAKHKLIKLPISSPCTS
jgi:hypothetical protein